MNKLQKAFYSTISGITLAQTAFGAIDPGINKIDDGIKGPDSGDDWLDTIQSFITYLLSFLAFIVVLMGLWGGWKILTSGAEDEGKEAGKKIIINAAIGVVVIFFAYTITNAIFSIVTRGNVGG